MKIQSKYFESFHNYYGTQLKVQEHQRQDNARTPSSPHQIPSTTATRPLYPAWYPNNLHSRHSHTRQCKQEKIPISKFRSFLSTKKAHHPSAHRVLPRIDVKIHSQASRKTIPTNLSAANTPTDTHPKKETRERSYGNQSSTQKIYATNRKTPSRWI